MDFNKAFAIQYDFAQNNTTSRATAREWAVEFYRGGKCRPKFPLVTDGVSSWREGLADLRLELVDVFGKTVVRPIAG